MKRTQQLLTLVFPLSSGCLSGAIHTLDVMGTYDSTASAGFANMMWSAHVEYRDDIPQDVILFGGNYFANAITYFEYTVGADTYIGLPSTTINAFGVGLPTPAGVVINDRLELRGSAFLNGISGGPELEIFEIVLEDNTGGSLALNPIPGGNGLPTGFDLSNIDYTSFGTSLVGSGDVDFGSVTKVETAVMGIPEPSRATLLILGCLAVVFSRRRPALAKVALL